MLSPHNGVEAAGVSGAGMGCEDFTCGCLSSAEDGVEAAGGLVGCTVAFILTKCVDQDFFEDLIWGFAV